MSATPSFAAVKEALAHAAALEGEARRAWLDGLAARDRALHAEVVALLAHESDDTPVAAVDGAARGVFGLPATIGPYRVLAALGEGGMGVVVRAMQTEPLRREVAVKVLRTPIVTDVAAARFRAEGRALARLNHPHVAAVYDAGVDASGRPYLAMEYVDGRPITTACLDRPLADVLAMFLDVCDAVRHAHQRGIVHRDLKPSNLLVARREGRDWPVVIDFGIARDEESGDAGVTRAGQILGTPAYMSPEQAGAFGGVVDTRTDVYALGVVLFELLTGRRPRDPGAASAEDLRRTLSGDVPRPSDVAGGPFGRLLRGDLDTIVAMALRPEPDRRYGSVAALAEDVRRHLDRRPVLARGDDVAYRVARFARRHVVGVAVAGALAATVAAGVVTGIVQDVRVREQRDRAVLAEQTARREAQTAHRVTDFVVRLFEDADPGASGIDVTARQLLDDGAARIDEELEADPSVRAALLTALARSYHGLGEHGRAAELATEALALREAGSDVGATIDALEVLATIRHDEGALDVSRGHLERALALAREAGDPERVATCANGLAVTLDAMGRYAEAEPLYREALAEWRRIGGDAHPEVPWALSTLAQVRYRLGHYREAERLLAEADALARIHQVSEADRAHILNNLGGVRLWLGDVAGAEAALREALALYEGLYGPDHAAVGRARRNLGDALAAKGEHDEAAALFEDGVRILTAALGPDHPLTASAMAGRGEGRLGAGDVDGARADLDAAYAILVAAKGPDHPDALALAVPRAAVAEALGEPVRPLLEPAVAGLDAALGPDHPRTALAKLALGRALRRSGACDEAVPVLEEARRATVAELGPEHLFAVWSAGELALCGTREGADPVARARAALEVRFGAGHPWVSDYRP